MRRLQAEDSPLDIYLAGGARLAGAVLPEIDRFVVKLYPVVAGDGHPMLAGGSFAPAGARPHRRADVPGRERRPDYDRR